MEHIIPERLHFRIAVEIHFGKLRTIRKHISAERGYRIRDRNGSQFGFPEGIIADFQKSGGQRNRSERCALVERVIGNLRHPGRNDYGFQRPAVLEGVQTDGSQLACALKCHRFQIRATAESVVADRLHGLGDDDGSDVVSARKGTRADLSGVRRQNHFAVFVGERFSLFVRRRDRIDEDDIHRLLIPVVDDAAGRDEILVFRRHVDRLDPHAPRENVSNIRDLRAERDARQIRTGREQFNAERNGRRGGVGGMGLPFIMTGRNSAI